MTNQNKTTLYVGVTSNLYVRVQQHKDGENKSSFTNRYNLHFLVYYEDHGSIEEAIAREKQVKNYSRKKKEALINSMNPEWKDLFETLD